MTTRVIEPLSVFEACPTAAIGGPDAQSGSITDERIERDEDEAAIGGSLAVLSADERMRADRLRLAAQAIRGHAGRIATDLRWRPAGCRQVRPVARLQRRTTRTELPGNRNSLQRFTVPSTWQNPSVASGRPAARSPGVFAAGSM